MLATLPCSRWRVIASLTDTLVQNLVVFDCEALNYLSIFLHCNTDIGNHFSSKRGTNGIYCASPELGSRNKDNWKSIADPSILPILLRHVGGANLLWENKCRMPKRTENIMWHCMCACNLASCNSIYQLTIKWERVMAAGRVRPIGLVHARVTLLLHEDTHQIYQQDSQMHIRTGKIQQTNAGWEGRFHLHRTGDPLVWITCRHQIRQIQV